MVAHSTGRGVRRLLLALLALVCSGHPIADVPPPQPGADDDDDDLSPARQTCLNKAASIRHVDNTDGTTFEWVECSMAVCATSAVGEGNKTCRAMGFGQSICQVKVGYSK